MIDRLYERGSLAFIYEATITAEHRVVHPWGFYFSPHTSHCPFLWQFLVCIIHMAVFYLHHLSERSSWHFITFSR